MIRSVAFIKRILVCFEPDYSSLLPVPSEDDNPEDGDKVDKIEAGGKHWDWLHRVWSSCHQRCDSREKYGNASCAQPSHDLHLEITDIADYQCTSESFSPNIWLVYKCVF